MLVPYNGSAEVTQGLLTGSTDFSFDGPSASLSLIQSGRFQVLAKFDPRLFPPAPDVPFINQDIPGLGEITVWLGIVAPKGTPAPIIDKLQGEVAKALANPAIKEKANNLRPPSRDDNTRRICRFHPQGSTAMVRGREGIRNEI